MKRRRLLVVVLLIALTAAAGDGPMITSNRRPWSLDERSRSVNKVEYEALFHK